MHKLQLTFFLVILSFSLTYSQKTIVGKILSNTTHVPIPYANIGVVNSTAGTISNLDGSFSIILPEKLSNDSLTFSSLGFFVKIIPVNQLKSNEKYTISLIEKATILKPVIITSKVKNKLIEVGNRVCHNGNYQPDTTYAGRSVALLIDIKNLPDPSSHPVYLNKANLYIFKNNFYSFKFRVRLNKYDSLTGSPGVDLIDKSIIVKSDILAGWINFDLSKLNFQITGPFFVTFEQLLDLKDRKKIAKGFRKLMLEHPDWFVTEVINFEGETLNNLVLTKDDTDLPGTFIGTTGTKPEINKFSCFVRETSLGEWHKLPKIVTATVSVNGLGFATNSNKTISALEIH
jgi:hypothetical protein